MKGFTLLELIIYITILTTTLYGLVGMALGIQFREGRLMLRVQEERELDLADISLSGHLFNK